MKTVSVAVSTRGPHRCSRPAAPLAFWRQPGGRWPQAVLLAVVAFAMAPHAGEAGIVTIALTGDPSPDGNGLLNAFGRPSINNAGQVAFTTRNFDSLSNADRNAIYLGSAGGGPLIQIVRATQTAPGGDGTFLSFTISGSLSEIPALNDIGGLAFEARLTGTSGVNLDDRAIYLGAGGGPLAQVVRGGLTLPDGNGHFYRFTHFTMNSSGQVLFAADVAPTTGGTAADSGLYLGSGTGPVQKVVREGDPSPDGNGTYRDLGPGGISDTGKVVFYSDLLGAMSSNVILSLGSGTAPPVILARQLDFVPDGDGRFSSFGLPTINSSGEVMFAAVVGFTAVPLINDQAIYRVTSAGGTRHQSW